MDTVLKALAKPIQNWKEEDRLNQELCPFLLNALIVGLECLILGKLFDSVWYILKKHWIYALLLVLLIQLIIFVQADC